ncbi:RHS repeat-associated protein, partial [Variovorax boronicumulans]|uniref:RHS repeat-associated core domain-containing protein n=1 Tax=Variovorax boronicumulans TaxID=436515 RepID=UPI0027837F75
PATTTAEQLGYAYVYDEQGTLIAEVGSGGTNSGGQAQYIYLPTANGPMPIAAIVNGNTYAVHSDHLNTPRKLTDASGQAVWQWGYSAFGEDKPTTARYRFADTETTPNPGTTNIAEVKFNLRYPGQYADEESGLSYNYFRSYDARTGRYSQPDPIGLEGGWNRFGYVDSNPLLFTDPEGLDPIGQAVGGAIGTWGGRAIGAAGGSFLGPGGTAIGSVVGGAIGNKALGALGSAIGDWCIAQNSNPCSDRTYHRVTSPSQTNNDLAAQVASGMICGGGRRQAGGGMSPIPSAKAFPGPLPPGQSGIEFKTSVCPSSDGPIVYWHLGSPGVIPVGDLACVPVTVTRTAP